MQSLRSIIVALMVVLSPISSVLGVSVLTNSADFEINPFTFGDEIFPGLPHGGVVRIGVFDAQFPGSSPSVGTGVFLEGGRFILTAAHLLDSPLGAPGDVDVDHINVLWETSEGIFTRSIGGTQGLFWNFHPDYLEWGAAPISSAFAGYDIALIDLGLQAPDPGSVPTYRLFRGNPDGMEYAVVGYGLSWQGSDNTTDTTSGIKRWATNRFDLNAAILEGTSRQWTQIISDLDNGDPVKDVSHTRFGGDPDPLPTTFEGLPAPGDSGASLFVQSSTNDWRIAAVASGARRTPDDVDTFPVANGSIGEGSVATRLDARNSPALILDGLFSIADWIDFTVGSSMIWKAIAGGNWDDPTAWTTPSGIDQTTLRRHIDAPADDDFYIAGPTGASTIKSLTIGGNQADRGVDMFQGGSITATEEIEIKTNGWMILYNGGVSASQLIISGPVPGQLSPPPGNAGLFWWQNNPSQGSSLTADRIVVRHGGWLVIDSPIGGNDTMDVDHLDIQPGGVALLETNPHFNQSITNAGVLDLGTEVGGNIVTADAFTQTETGLFVTFVDGEGPNSVPVWDRLTITGGATLDGALHIVHPEELFAYNSPIPIIGASSISGVFDQVFGLGASTPRASPMTSSPACSPSAAASFNSVSATA